MNNNGIEQGKYDPKPRPLRMGEIVQNDGDPAPFFVVR
jgi:hypothetical protein